jgi:hypothetical protein
MIINLAQAHKWGGKPVEAAKIIASEDWSSCGTQFKLAVAVLADEFERAAGMMKAIAAADLLRKNDYRDWPLFKEFRKSQAFLDAYQNIYGHQLIPIEPSPADSFFGPFSEFVAAGTPEGSEATGTTLPDQSEGVVGSPPT